MADGIALGFASGAGIDRLEILGAEGRDWIHRPFELDLLLARFGGPLSREEVDALVGAPAVVAFGAGPHDRMHGVIETVLHLDSPRSKAQLYVARMIPQVGLLTKGRRSAIYQDTTVPDLVAKVLESYGLSRGEDFELRLSGSFASPVREYIVQYQESDWSFLARWLEHEGIFAVFEHHEDRTSVVFCDDNLSTPQLHDPPAIPYRLANNVSSGHVETVWDVGILDRQVARLVSVADYNYRRPAQVILAAHRLPAPSFGHVALYGEHPKDEEQAAALARIRAEEAGAERRVLSATTDRVALRAGHRFHLENHYVAEHDGEWLATGTHFAAGRPVPRAGRDLHATSSSLTAPADERRYRATVEAIPTAIAYRPARTTPWPSIHGVLHAHVQSDGAGEVAEIDELGRYKVRMPFDLATKGGLGASRWVRKAQPYAGAGYGMHFPLHKGTEVLIAHIDGDPDRPIIVGAAPHAVTPSPVNRANATQSVIQTASGIRVEMEDRQS